MGPPSTLETGRAGIFSAAIFFLRSEQEMPDSSLKRWKMGSNLVLFNLLLAFDPTVPASAAAGEGAGLSRGLETGAGGLVPPWWYACKPSWFRTSLGTVDSQSSPSSILSKNDSRSGGAMMPAVRFLFEIQLFNFRAFERLTMVGNKTLSCFVISSLLRAGSFARKRRQNDSSAMGI